MMPFTLRVAVSKSTMAVAPSPSPSMITIGGPISSVPFHLSFAASVWVQRMAFTPRPCGARSVWPSVTLYPSVSNCAPFS